MILSMLHKVQVLPCKHCAVMRVLFAVYREQEHCFSISWEPNQVGYLSHPADTALGHVSSEPSKLDSRPDQVGAMAVGAEHHGL